MNKNYRKNSQDFFGLGMNKPGNNRMRCVRAFQIRGAGFDQVPFRMQRNFTICYPAYRSLEFKPYFFFNLFDHAGMGFVYVPKNKSIQDQMTVFWHNSPSITEIIFV